MLELNTCCLIGMMLWVKEEASKCLSDTNSESSPALPCPFHSSVCASVTGWPGGVLHFFIMLHPESTSPEANSLLTICFSLSLCLCFFSAWDIFSELLIPLTHSFWKVLFYCSSSGTIVFPRHWSSLPYPLSLCSWRSVPSLKVPAKRQQACMHWNKEKHSPKPVIFYPFRATLISR